MSEYKNAPAVGGQGAINAYADSGMRAHHASPSDQLQWRLSAFALALDAVLPDLAYLQHVVELSARGGPMPGDCPQRLYRLALKMFDLRQVLEIRLPEVLHGR